MDVGPSLRAFLAASLIAGAAHAEGADVVRVGGPCLPPGTEFGEVLRILRAELAPTIVVGLDAPSVPSFPLDPKVEVLEIDACAENPPGARVTARFGDRHREHWIQLEDATPEARSRTLALALAETARYVTAEPPAPADTPVPTPPSTPSQSSRPDTSAKAGTELSARAGATFRFIPATATPIVGLDAGIAGRRLGVSLALLGAHGNTSIGSITVLALAAAATVDAVELGPLFRLRATGELGIATGSGTPRSPATDRAATALHAALSAGIAAVIQMETRWALEGFVGAGHATSLSAQADGHDAVSLGGWFITTTLGGRLPPFGAL